MTFFFLDDEQARHQAFAERSRPHRVVATKDPLAAIGLLQADGGRFDVAFLDRDLGHVLTGENVAAAMARLPFNKRPRRVVVHSQNKLGGDAMVRTLRSAGYHVIRAPFVL
jgi:hypothetical protein